MTRLLVPCDETELMLLTSILEGSGIEFHVQNEHFGSLYPGLNIFPFNERVILVAESDFDRASLLAHDFLESMKKTSEPGGEVG
jgi:putative signal transducing protein